jgi:succinate-semialdehyde dehydrogenase/glutarate-semialdehyde dehydrogenase
MKSDHDFTLKDFRPVATDLLIGSAWRAGQGARIEVVDPADGKSLTTISNASVADAMAALDAATAAGKDWAATPPRQRGEILRRAFEAMTRETEWLAALMTAENGKPLAESRGEIAYAADFFRWYAEEAVRMLGEVSLAPAGNARLMVEYQPVGPCLLITPWNFPAAMVTRKIGPALAAGCTVILKPAIETPLTALAIAQLLLEAGLPPGVLNIITPQDPAPVSAALMKDQRLRKISFTGSTPVGRLLLKGAADNILKASMELGGNAPFVVLDDADIDAAIEGAMIAKMRNGGQACTAANRFYVQRGIAKAFTDRLVSRMGAVRMGRGDASDTTLGPLITQKAVSKVAALVGGALGEGAKCLLGGKSIDGKGYFYPPTVLADVPPGAAILKEEIFGPVATIVTFDDVEDAIAMANDTEFGLVSFLYTRDLARGLKLAERLESGMVALNRGLVSDAAAPFGGVKQSGLGREGGHHGLMEFIEPKYISTVW